MAGFNKLPTKQDSASSSSSGAGIYPIFEADPSYNGPSADATYLGQQNYAVGGYDNNGDYILLPTASTGSMTYYDNTATQVTTGSWSGGILHTDIDAASDAWVGFMLDDTDATMYVCTVDTTATPDKFNLASITKAGVITNISAAGGTAIVTDFTTSPAWGLGVESSGSSCLYRTSDGTGNLIVNVSGSNILEQAVFNVGTGALEADKVIIKHTTASSYKTPAGNYIGGFTYSPDQKTFYLSGRSTVYITIKEGIGLASNTAGLHPLQWGGRIVLAAFTNGLLYGGPRAYAVDEFNTKVDELCAANGCEV